MRKSKALVEIEARAGKLTEELAIANANVHAIASRLDELEMMKARIVSEGFKPGVRPRSKVKAAIREKTVKQFNDTAAEAAQAAQQQQEDTAVKQLFGTHAKAL